MAKPEAPNNLISYCLKGNEAGVKACIDKNPACVNSRSKLHGYSPLQIAASAEENVEETMQLLLEAGADLKHQDMVCASQEACSLLMARLAEATCALDDVMHTMAHTRTVANRVRSSA